jgi:D-3-phosphoglycerate dehydrogenase
VNILVTPRSFGKTNPELFDRLRDAGLTVARNNTGGILSADQMREMLASCEGVILGVDPMNAEVLAAAPRLRAIAKYGVGLDNIDLNRCKQRGIAVSRTTGANSNAVADYAFALILAVARKMAAIDRRCRAGDWGKITGADVYGKTLGIVGLGAVGKCVVRRARGFDMRILASDIVWDDPYAETMGIERVDIETLCREADIITLHTELTEDTRAMINAKRLSVMKTSAIVINTARGGLIDEGALLAALRGGRIYGAGLDVFEEEPPTEAAWRGLETVVMGSHCASSTLGATEAMGRMAVDNLLRDLNL